MKTINYFKMLMVVVAVFVVSLVATTDIKAQTTYKPYFGNVDWQFNAPLVMISLIVQVVGALILKADYL